MRERRRDEPVHASREQLGRSIVVRGGARPATRTRTVESRAPRRARAPSSASAPRRSAHRAIGAVAAAVGVHPPRRLPIQVVRELVRDRPGRRRDRQLDRARPRIVHRERRIRKRLISELDVESGERQRGKHALHVLQGRLELIRGSTAAMRAARRGRRSPTRGRTPRPDPRRSRWNRPGTRDAPARKRGARPRRRAAREPRCVAPNPCDWRRRIIRGGERFFVGRAVERGRCAAASGTTIGAAGGRSAPSALARAAKCAPSNGVRRAACGDGRRRSAPACRARGRAPARRSSLRCATRRRAARAAGRSTRNDVLSRRSSSSVSTSRCFRVAGRVGEQVGEVALREHAIAHERGRLGRDGDRRRRDGRLPRADHVGEAHGQFTGARIGRRFDRPLDEREMLRAGRAVAVGVPRPEAVEQPTNRRRTRRRVAAGPTVPTRRVYEARGRRRSEDRRAPGRRAGTGCRVRDAAVRGR